MRRPVDVLLIEPNARHAEIIRGALERSCKPCALEIVSTPEEARDFIDGAPPANGRFSNPFLIIAELLDPQEPPAAGLLHWLRAHERTKHLPVVVLATTDDPAAVRTAYDRGASSYLVKPPNENDLGTLVDAAVQYWIQLNHPAD